MQNMTREMCGLAHYKQCTMQLLEVSKDKCALKLNKKRVSTHIHANVPAVMRKAVAKTDAPSRNK